MRTKHFTAFLAIFVLISILVAMHLKNRKVSCNKLDFTAEIVSNDPLTLRFQLIETDLPDNTDILVSIGKSYYVNYNMEAYPIEYYSKQTKIADIKREHSIRIYLQKDKQQIERARNIRSKFGETFEVKEIDTDISFKILVPVQRDAKFGQINRNLTGKMVTKAEGLGFPIIEVNKTFHFN